MRPATAKLAFIRSIRTQLHSQTPRTAHSAFIRTNSLTLTALQNHLCTHHFLSLPLLLACPNPHSLFAAPLPCGSAVPHLPTRFRALALFGRRPPQRVVRSSLPASENLHKTRIRPFRAMSASTSYGHAAPGILGGARHPGLPVAAPLERPRSRPQRNTWRLTVSLRTQSPSKCLTVYGGGEPLRAAGDQWCSEARSVHRVA